MYAVIQSGGKQYKVTQGELVRMDVIKAEKGATVNFDVLAFNDGANLVLGTPLVDTAKVSGKVVTHGRAKKIIVFTYKRRKGFHKKRGHRQEFTEVMIDTLG
ncbi:TPA: 50S ribosomal protein L21 [Candidatus Sumerlaeota bacterium]|jgi:large subunit ribosomal protein L21|nr:50S ribosomal protein L21 [Candidatus Sumerlaeota bacterium]